MSKYSELVADLRRGVEFDMRREKPFCIRDAAADAITKLEAEKAELAGLLAEIEDVLTHSSRNPDRDEGILKIRATLAKLEAGQ